MGAKLAAARARLRQALADLNAGRGKIAAQQHRLGAIVAQNYQTGDPSLMGLSIVLTSQDPTELTGQLNSVQNVLDKQSVLMDRLEASRALLTVQSQEVRAAQVEVAAPATGRGGEPAAQAGPWRRRRRLPRRRSARSWARAPEARVAAEEAKQADLAQLRNLETERARIAAVLKRRADEARRRAAAAAAAAGRSGPVLGDGGPVQSGGYLDYPVSAPVTSPFGWRTHPIFGYRSLHDGVDFGAACGTPIRAVASGRVLEEYFQTAWGNRIVIDHGFHRGAGLATISNHLSSYAVRAGDRVSRGQVVGYVGTTGWSTGCHLHFTVMQDGRPVDPMTWF